MARRRDRDLEAVIAGHVAALVADLHTLVRQRVQDEAAAFFGGLTARAGSRRGPKRIRPCLAPGCQQPSKGPRFRYLCDEHKGAPLKDVEAWRASRKAASNGTANGPRRARAAKGAAKPAATAKA